MAGYDRMDYVRRLGVQPKNGVYTFTFDEGDDVHDQLVGDLASEFGVAMPKQGETVKISVSGSRVTGLSVSPSGGRRRRSRLNKKTRRSKRNRGYTKRR
jgi:hypothetical protein